MWRPGAVAVGFLCLLLVSDTRALLRTNSHETSTSNRDGKGQGSRGSLAPTASDGQAPTAQQDSFVTAAPLGEDSDESSDSSSDFQLAAPLGQTDSDESLVDGTPFAQEGCAARHEPSFSTTTCCGGQRCGQPSGVCCSGYCCPTMHICVPLLDKCSKGIPAPKHRSGEVLPGGNVTHLVPPHPFQEPPEAEEEKEPPRALRYPKLLVPDIPNTPPPRNRTRIPPAGFMADVQPIAGGPWPPVPALSNDGSPGMWSKRDMVDWRGFGLIRNGTQNVVADLETCQDQCQAMSECRLVFFDRITHECWLDTKFADVPRACPDSLLDVISPGTRAGMTPDDPVLTRDCITFFKKVKEEDLMVPQAPSTTIERSNWLYKEGLNFNGPVKRSLIRNGRRNIVASMDHCIEQCAKLKYCRTLVYFRPTKECWLSSRVAYTGVRCAMRRGRRSCASWIKKLAPAELEFIKHTLRWSGRHPSTPRSRVEEEEEGTAIALANAVTAKAKVLPHVAGGVQIEVHLPKKDD